MKFRSERRQKGVNHAYGVGFVFKMLTKSKQMHTRLILRTSNQGCGIFTIFTDPMGCPKLNTYFFNSLEIVPPEKRVPEEKKRINYYPFGLKHKGYNNNPLTNHPYKFQGQELTEDLGLNVYEWKYRVHDPAIGRFWQVDPLAEDYEWMTTYQFSSNQPIHAPELEGLESQSDLNDRLYFDGKITKDEYFQNIKTRAMGVVVSAAIVTDVVATKGAVTKSLVEQMAIQSLFTAADQVISGKGIDANAIASEAIGNADLFDAGFDALAKKLPGGAIVSEIMDHLAPSMVDITLDGGVEVGGANKSMSDVAIDFSFSVVTDNIKSTNIPNMKISGNSAVRNVKDRIVEYSSGKARDLPGPSTRPSVGRRSSTRETNIRVQDNTRVRKNVPNF